MSHYSNPTANAAIGAAERELRLAQKLAKQLQRRKMQGLLTQQEVAAAWRECPRAYRRILRKALDGQCPLTIRPGKARS